MRKPHTTSDSARRVLTVGLVILAGACGHRGSAATTSNTSRSAPTAATVPATTVPVTLTPRPTVPATVTTTTTPTTSAVAPATSTTVVGQPDYTTIDWVPIVQRLQDRIAVLWANPTADGVAGFCVAGGPCDDSTGAAIRAMETNHERMTNVPPTKVTSATVVPFTYQVDPDVQNPMALVQLSVRFEPTPETTSDYLRNGVPVKKNTWTADDGSPIVFLLADRGPADDKWRVMDVNRPGGGG